ncbi:hypothetical protein AB0C47_13190 [Micromonospora taraxaci]|uniref:hypothetical protein n=1 Tax=Micromonospora taraxaci TaxID=1316803 RepID=UPI0033D352F7
MAAVIEVALGRHLPALQVTSIVVISAGLLAPDLGGGRATWPALPVAGAIGPAWPSASAAA